MPTTDPAPTALSPDRRARIAASLDGASYDVVVVGGGVTGSGVALDAASRGLSVLVLEAHDLAAGTSSRSSKLIHGGLRYLEQLDFGLVREALEERGRLADELCPHLVKPLAFLYPLTHRYWERPYVAAGIAIYDGLAKLGGDKLPRQRHFSRDGVARRFPGLKADAMVGAVQYWDAQVDDARHTMMVMRTAAGHGAELLTNAEVVSFVGATEGRVCGVVVNDRETGQTATVNAGVVINATGVWTEKTEQLSGHPGLRVRASKGIHLVVPRKAIDGDCGVITKTRTSVLFIIPSGDHWLLGTTDTDWTEALSEPVATATDIEYVLEQANAVLERPLTKGDIVGVFSGLRPLIAGSASTDGQADTSDLSREHAIAQPVPGLVSIAGGKYTTYRVMAAVAVDAAINDLPAGPGAGRSSSVPPSSTEDLKIHGAKDYARTVAASSELAIRLGISEQQVERLLSRYGSAVSEIAELVSERPAWSRELDGGGPYLEAEAVLAVRAEGARHLDDVMARRLRLSIESRDRGLSAASRVAELMGDELGWDSRRRELEVAAYRERVEGELAGEATRSDAAAMAERAKATDVRDTLGR